jgi:thiamine monophosphate synthase
VIYLDLDRICKSKAIKFYVANDIKLAILLNSDGIYLSSYNKRLKFLNYKKSNFEIIGSAHNLKKFLTKINKDVASILLSKLFLVDYNKEFFMPWCYQVQ